MEKSPTLPAMVCSECTSATLETAPFVLRCQEMNQKWNQILDHISTMKPLPNFTNSVCVNVDNSGITETQSPVPIKTVARAVKFVNKPHSFTGGIRGLGDHLKLECPDCKKVYPRLYILNRHLRNINKKMCIYCGRVVHCDAYLEHLKIHGRTERMCNVCKETIKNDSNYVKHIRTCQRKGSHGCVECSLTFNTEAKLVLHQSTRHKLSVCNGCRQGFRSRACFKNHRKRCAKYQSRFDTYICDYCKKEYNCKSTLRLHIRYVHVVGWEYQCAQCSKMFISAAHLREHDNTHNRVEDRYVCSVCGNKYSTRRGYERHYKRHFDENGQVLETIRPYITKPYRRKLYKCIICDLVSVKQTIQAHMKNKHQTLQWEECATLVRCE